MAVSRWRIDDRLAFWHPVIESDRLASRPVAAMACGTPIVVFRTGSGDIAALYDRCAHRRAPLSAGRVDGDNVLCPYHGCAFDASGASACPGAGRDQSPAVSFGSRLRVPSFAARVCRDVVWVRCEQRARALGLQADAGLHGDLDSSGDEFAGVVGKTINAPLQLVVDNMTELEHTGAVHEQLAFGVDDLAAVRTSCDDDGERLAIFYRGRQRPLPFYLSLLTGVRRGDDYVQTAEVSFRPPCASYAIHWQDDDTRRPVRLRFVIYYTPIDEAKTRLFAFVYWHAEGHGRHLAMRVSAPILRAIVSRELERDKAIIEKLPVDEAHLHNFQLSRFDTPLIKTRGLMAQHYVAGSQFDQPAPVSGHEPARESI